MENEKAAIDQGNSEAKVNAANQSEQQQAEELSSLLGSGVSGETNNADSDEQPRMFPGVL